MMDDSAPKSSGFAAAVSHYGLLYGRARQQATRADRIVTIPPDGTAMAWGNFEVFSMFRNFEHDRAETGVRDVLSRAYQCKLPPPWSKTAVRPQRTLVATIVAPPWTLHR
jgi:hypothetical protein